MKSLWKISRRYVLSAILLTVLVLYANIAVFLVIGIKYMNPQEKNSIGRDTMESIGKALQIKEGEYTMSSEGMKQLGESSFIWAMFLNESGDVAWSWQLPQDFSMHYSIGDVSAFSRWYLNDYPVRTWKTENGLMVYGIGKNSVVRYNLIYDSEMLYEIPDVLKSLLLVNITLLLGLAFFFAYRFYHSIRPIGEGIEQLAEKKAVHVPQKGITAELSSKLNQASAILMSQDKALQRRDMARTEWIAGVSHDIRTPLALITGYADELAREPEIGEEGRKRAKQIQNLSLVIGQLIADLNLTSKLEYQAQPLYQDEFSPAGLLRECVAEYYNQGLANEYELEVEITSDAEQVKLIGDRGLLLRAFRNLIGNSVRHNPQGCVVNIQLTRSDNGVAYLFSDSGNGIPPLVVDTLMERVPLPAPGTQTVHVMGLRIVMQIIKAHGGIMSFERKENGNYNVHLFLK